MNFSVRVFEKNSIIWMTYGFDEISTHLRFGKFLQRIPENHNVNSCINELLCLEYGEVRSQLKLRACSAVFSALDNISEAVQICNEDNQIQVSCPIHRPPPPPQKKCLFSCCCSQVISYCLSFTMCFL